MEDSQMDAPNRCPNPSDVQQEAGIYEGEINLIDYFLVLWKRKYFIILASVLPALVVGFLSYSLPRDYKATYVYDVNEWNLTERNYNVLLDKFYSGENVDKVVFKLRENDLSKHADLMSGSGGRETLRGFVDFQVLPPYVNLSGERITDPAKIEQIRELKAQLLKMTVTGRPKNDIPRISLVIRDNFENIIPVYLVKEQLNAITRTLKSDMADIEENKFDLELDLKINELSLAKLENIKVGASYKSEGDVTLQFDVGSRSEYLPIEYQVQASQLKIIQLEEKIATNENRYKYYENLLALNDKLFIELNSNISSYYTLQQFHAFLRDLASGYDGGVRGYLNSYVKKIENRMSASVPVTEKPKVYPISRGTVRKSGTTFVVALMISIFVAFVLEGLKKSQAQTS